MRPLILKMDISLDGFVGAVDGDVQWAVEDFGDPALQEWMVAGLWDAGTHLMGRGAYDDMAPYWPTSTDVYAPPMNEIPKVVFSRTLTDPEWADTRVVSGDLATEIAEAQGRGRQAAAAPRRRELRAGARGARADRRVPAARASGRARRGAAAVR